VFTNVFQPKRTSQENLMTLNHKVTSFDFLSFTLLNLFSRHEERSLILYTEPEKTVPRLYAIVPRFHVSAWYITNVIHKIVSRNFTSSYYENHTPILPIVPQFLPNLQSSNLKQYIFNRMGWNNGYVLPWKTFFILIKKN
jgi:hypothetical protein